MYTFGVSSLNPFARTWYARKQFHSLWHRGRHRSLARRAAQVISPEGGTSLPAASAAGLEGICCISPEGGTCAPPYSINAHNLILLMVNSHMSPSGLKGANLMGPVADATGKDMPPSGLSEAALRAKRGRPPG